MEIIFPIHFHAPFDVIVRHNVVGKQLSFRWSIKFILCFSRPELQCVYKSFEVVVNMFFWYAYPAHEFAVHSHPIEVTHMVLCSFEYETAEVVVLDATWNMKKDEEEWVNIILVELRYNYRSEKWSALFLVGRNFSPSPIITIENKGFEIFSRPKF